jgi:predicted O-methyltransferase YrrM
LDSARRLRRELRFLLALRVLPPRVALFQWRARRLAARIGDEFSLVSATRPPKLAVLVSLAGSRGRVVELGTATGWTAISLVLADRRRTVTSYDPVQRAERDRYLQLIGSEARDRLEFVAARGAEGPQRDGPVDVLYIDSSHSQDETVRELQVWRPVLVNGALVVFDDFAHPQFPGVRDAVLELKLEGEQREGLFVHRVTA